MFSIELKSILHHYAAFDCSARFRVHEVLGARNAGLASAARRKHLTKRWAQIAQCVRMKLIELICCKLDGDVSIREDGEVIRGMRIEGHGSYDVAGYYPDAAL